MNLGSYIKSNFLLHNTVSEYFFRTFSAFYSVMLWNMVQFVLTEKSE